VFYVGDRVKRPGQLNGKSANLNHVVLRKIFPHVRKADEVRAWRDMHVQCGAPNSVVGFRDSNACLGL
jgi:hypothetical protein